MTCVLLARLGANRVAKHKFPCSPGTGSSQWLNQSTVSHKHLPCNQLTDNHKHLLCKQRTDSHNQRTESHNQATDNHKHLLCNQLTDSHNQRTDQATDSHNQLMDSHKPLLCHRVTDSHNLATDSHNLATDNHKHLLCNQLMDNPLCLMDNHNQPTDSNSPTGNRLCLIRNHKHPPCRMVLKQGTDNHNLTTDKCCTGNKPKRRRRTAPSLATVNLQCLTDSLHLTEDNNLDSLRLRTGTLQAVISMAKLRILHHSTVFIRFA
jgi:hypothetical protein